MGDSDGRRIGGEDIAAGAFVAHLFAGDELVEVQGGIDAGVGEFFGVGA